MRRFIYWLRRKWRIQEKRCGQCCLICPYYEECSGDYKKEKKSRIVGPGSGPGLSQNIFMQNAKD